MPQGLSSLQRPFFTIGLPTYNRHDLLKKSLGSCLRQAFTDFEVIVGNDYPQEKLSSADFGINDARVRFVNNEKNFGPRENMNALLAEAKGRYFVWLSDDDMFMPDFLRAVHQALERNNFPSCVYTSYLAQEECPEKTAAFTGEALLLTGRNFLKSYLRRSLDIQGWYGIFETEYFRNIGGMRQFGGGSFSPYTDSWFPIRAGLLKDVVFIPAPLIFYRTHEGSISFTSTDLDAYSGSQQALLESSLEIFRSDGLKEDFDDNLYYILKWYIRDYLEVLRRAGRLPSKKISAYRRFIAGYWRQMHRHRIRLIVRTGFEVLKYSAYFIFSFLKIKMAATGKK